MPKKPVARRRGKEFAIYLAQEPTVSFDSSQDAKERIKQAVDIVDLVSRHLSLRRQGRNYVALCPWHDDSRPSLQVNPERQSWKCWVCDIGGDVFSFVMKMEGVEFREALEILADQTGIALPPRRGGGAGEQGYRGIGVSGYDARGDEESQTSYSPTPSHPHTPTPSAAGGKRTLFQTMAWAEQQYHDCLLKAPEAEPARKYLRERGLTAESVAKFHLGYSPPGWDWIVRRAKGTPHKPELLEAVGILGRSPNSGRIYDRFTGRVLFSIRDAQNRPVGVGGRVLPESGSTSPAKYINSPETPLFTKNRLLYGLDVARDAIRKTHTALVMEGYTDCIVAHQCGFGEAVAVLGTALGANHIRTLTQFDNRVRIVLVLDGDDAGQRRANEVLELFVSANADLRVVTLPSELDPCEFLLEQGADAFREILDQHAVDGLEHAYRAKTRGIDLNNDIHAASRALDELVSIVAKAPRLREDSPEKTPLLRENIILERLARSFRVPEQDVRTRLTELRRSGEQRAAIRRSDPPAARTPPAPTAPIDPWQRELLELLVTFPRCVVSAGQEIRPEHMANASCRAIYATCVRLADAGMEPTFDRLMLELDDAGVKSLLVELDEKGRAKGIRNPEGLLEELLRSLRAREINKRSPLDVGAMRQPRLDEAEQLAMLQQIVQRERARHGISKPTDG